jgi:hypothetical protein
MFYLITLPIRLMVGILSLTAHLIGELVEAAARSNRRRR